MNIIANFPSGEGHTRMSEERQYANHAISFQEYKKNIEKTQEKVTEADEYCANTIAETLGVLGNRPLKFSIYRVPIKLRKINENAYNPHIVPIGPFNQHREDLSMMEEHKWRYTLRLLHRTKDPKVTLGKCVDSINNLEKEVPGCYAEDLNMTWKKLMEILIVDGCFILELFIRYFEKNESDEIINSAWMIPTIKHDLALLENQIPFCVLENLFEVVEKHTREDLSFPCSLTEYALHFFLPNPNSETDQAVKALNSQKINGSPNKPRHLLEMLHIFYRPSSLESHLPEVHDTWGFKHSATKLLEAGIRIEKVETSELLEIEFSEGVIKLPPLSIHETMETVFRNLIAFEQCSVRVTHHITSYAMLIKSLIASTQDMVLLQDKQIIEKPASSGEHVPTFFKRMSREVVLKEFCFAQLCDNVDKYSRSWLHCHRIKAYAGIRCRRYITALRNDYFSNPWRIISFVAAVVLLVLTFLQTMYTMLSYY